MYILKKHASEMWDCEMEEETIEHVICNCSMNHKEKYYKSSRNGVNAINVVFYAFRQWDQFN